jgi:hypothetical protein
MDTGASAMTPIEEQQLLVSLAGMAQDIKALLALTKEMSLQQDKVGEKTIQHLLNIAHKR